jgi:hypothetical protein
MAGHLVVRDASGHTATFLRKMPGVNAELESGESANFKRFVPNGERVKATGAVGEFISVGCADGTKGHDRTQCPRGAGSAPWWGGRGPVWGLLSQPT